MITPTPILTVKIILASCLVGAAHFKSANWQDVESSSSPMTLKDLILSRNKTDWMTFHSTLSMRPEFQHINWRSKDPSDLAEQVWSLEQHDSPDTTYHRKLNSCLRSVMIIQDIEPTFIEEVMEIISSKIRQTRKKEHQSRKKMQRVSPEEMTLIKLKRANKLRHKRQQKAQGFGLPLLSYMSVPRGAELCPKIIHEAALAHRDKYWSCRSFVHALKQMWITLGFREGDVLQQTLDRSNYSFATWPSRKKTERSIKDLSNTSRQGPGSPAIQVLSSNRNVALEDAEVAIHRTQFNSLTDEEQSESDWIDALSGLPDLVVPRSNTIQATEIDDLIDERDVFFNSEGICSPEHNLTDWESWSPSLL